MQLSSFLKSWSGPTFRHIPADSPYGVLDFRFAGQGDRNRWNHKGQPTLYLASDYAVAVTEFGRHLERDRSREIARRSIARQVYRLQVAVERVLDLTDACLCASLSLSNAPSCFLDVGVAQATAEYLRQTTAAQGLIVPSIAFLDDTTRWVMVLFLDKLPSDCRQFVLSVDHYAEFGIS